MQQEAIHIKYLVTTPQDRQWGLTVNSVGTQNIGPGEEYPPRQHPTRYHFDPSEGRVLEEYQLVFLTRGTGVFRSAAQPEETRVKEGDMFLLFPGEWHTYRPDPKTGWTEMWIGFSGHIMDQWMSTCPLSKGHPVYHVGIKEELINLYRQAMKCAEAQESAFQQMLCGLVCNLLSSCIYFDRNSHYRRDSVQDIISTAREYISGNINEASPESTAEHVSVGYSKMRKLFKQYTGLTLGQYIAEVRTNKARDLLSNTDMPIGAIAGTLGFENEEYFSTYFKRITGKTPTTYRNDMGRR